MSLFTYYYNAACALWQPPTQPATIAQVHETIPLNQDQLVHYKSNHLEFAGQTYVQHFRDAIKYSMLSFKASICFLVHALLPNIFQHSGSDIIVGLNDEILQKYADRIEALCS